MPGLAVRGGKGHIAYLEQPPKSSSMELLQEEILVGEWPECPDFMKDDYQASSGARLPLNQRPDQVARIAKSAEAVGAVLDQHFARCAWQLPNNSITGSFKLANHLDFFHGPEVGAGDEQSDPFPGPPMPQQRPSMISHSATAR